MKQISKKNSTISHGPKSHIPIAKPLQYVQEKVIIAKKNTKQHLKKKTIALKIRFIKLGNVEGMPKKLQGLYK